MQVANNESFNGDAPTAVITLSGTGTGKLQARTRTDAGVVAWVDVPDGLLTAPTCVSVVTTPSTQFRLTDLAAGAVADIT